MDVLRCPADDAAVSALLAQCSWTRTLPLRAGDETPIHFAVSILAHFDMRRLHGRLTVTVRGGLAACCSHFLFPTPWAVTVFLLLARTPISSYPLFLDSCLTGPHPLVFAILCIPSNAAPLSQTEEFDTRHSVPIDGLNFAREGGDSLHAPSPSPTPFPLPLSARTRISSPIEYPSVSRRRLFALPRHRRYESPSLAPHSSNANDMETWTSAVLRER